MVAPCLSKADCSISTEQLSKQHTELCDEDGFEQVKLHPQDVWWQWVNSKDGNDMRQEDRASATAAVAVARQPTPAVLAFNRFGPLKDQVGLLPWHQQAL